MILLRFLVLIFLAIATPLVAEQVVEHQGRPLVTFDLPGFDLRGQRTGKTSTLTYVGQDSLEKRVQVQVKIRGWLGPDKAEKEYREDRMLRRQDPHTRLGEDLVVSGATKALEFRTTQPYEAHVLVIYTNDFRCEFTLTGSEATRESREALFSQLRESVKVPKGGLRLSPEADEPTPEPELPKIEFRTKPAPKELQD